jgi:hypothetical protein
MTSLFGRLPPTRCIQGEFATADGVPTLSTVMAAIQLSGLINPRCLWFLILQMGSMILAQINLQNSGKTRAK